MSSSCLVQVTEEELKYVLEDEVHKCVVGYQGWCRLEIRPELRQPLEVEPSSWGTSIVLAFEQLGSVFLVSLHP